MLAALKLVPLRFWLYLAAGLAIFGAYAWWTHHQRAIGDANCEARHAADQAQIAELQKKVDAQASAQNAPVVARYQNLTEALATYDRSPIAIPGCGRAPDDIVRAVNAAHSRPRL